MKIQVYCYDCRTHQWVTTPAEADFQKFTHTVLLPKHRVYVEEFTKGVK